MEAVRGMAGYTAVVLRVDLTREQITPEYLTEDVLRLHIGGAGLGAKFLYNEVPPGVGWDDPENRLIFATGPMNGCRVAGTGSFCVVTKGPLTGGATSSQANGYLGAYLKFSGFDAIIFQGKAKRWLYLYVHDGTAELRDAGSLLGKDTWQTEEQVKAELGKGEQEASVFSIGPAGENLVKFAAIVGDRGHVAGHNGTGAVMGSKKLKAVVVARGSKAVVVKDTVKLQTLSKKMIEEFKTTPQFDWGTSWLYSGSLASGMLPVKNLTTNLFPEHARFMGENYYSRFELVKKHPCWACSSHHCDILKVKEGPYAGYVGEDPEYEGWAAWGSLIGSTDVEAAFVLGNMTDRLGMETNESGWLLAFTLECYQRGLITEKDTGGLKLTWGNTAAIMEMLGKIARREGLGDILAEGVMRASQKLGKGAIDLGVYLKKGNAPRGHDHRARWAEMFDVAISNTGTLETGLLVPSEKGLSPSEEVATIVSRGKGMMTFLDSLVMCIFPTNWLMHHTIDGAVEMFNAVTGWSFTAEEAKKAGLRTVNLMRSFNIRHGINPEVEYPSTRYSSAPIDGPVKGVSVAPHWEQMLDIYYKNMGWDRASGRPLPETLKSLGLDYVIADLWKTRP